MSDEVEHAPLSSNIARSIQERILAELNVEPFGVAQLQRIVQVAEAGRRLLQAADPASTAFTPPHRRPMMGLIDAEFDDDVGAAANPMSSPLSALSSETFGGKSIRELIGMATQLADAMRLSPAKIAEGIAIAREHGLKDVEQSLLAALPMPKVKLEQVGPLEVATAEDLEARK